ncbi:esterase family protein [Mesobacillus boroniphilus]|uniref:Esterase family protein n=1 Tax=Mesobacillus boroniphilus TaxID=308892 RepID=A0A944CIK7_9BACI|nr:esterase family protein [Mesobacillus boroniphilus]MBS8263135.1 esterase family protein [Mesobacillus boroniphilus]
MDFPMGKIEEITLQSKELGEEVTMLVYLPANYSPLYKYSLLIAQDGRDYFQLGRIGRIADELLGKKEIENVIIVGIPYESVEDRRRKYHPKGEQHQAYIRFLAHELVPYLDEQYPTYQMGMGRALIGDSLAATVSLLAALQYPHTFGKVLLQSPYVNEEVFSAVKDFRQPELLHIYHTVGDQETVVKTASSKNKDFLTPNRELSKIFKERGYGYFYDEFNGNHTWTYWQPDLKRAIRQVFS